MFSASVLSKPLLQKDSVRLDELSDTQTYGENDRFLKRFGEVSVKLSFV